MKYLIAIFFIVTALVYVNSQGMIIPKNLEPEAKALKKEMEAAGVRFIGEMPDPTTLGKMSPELKAKGEAFKAKLVAAGVFVPPMPGA